MDDAKRERNQRLGLLGLFMLALLLLFYACGPDIQDGFDEGGAPGTAPFTIHGNASQNMTPGARAAKIDVRVTNPSDDRLRVTGLAVTVQQISAPRATNRLPCTRSDFRVRQAPNALDVTIAADSTSTLSELDVPARSWPRVGMLNHDKNQDGCQQSTLTLGYTASGALRR